MEKIALHTLQIEQSDIPDFPSHPPLLDSKLLIIVALFLGVDDEKPKLRPSAFVRYQNKLV